MARVLRILGVVLLLLGGFALPAQAADERIRHLDVRFDVHADGSMDVRYELDWDFGERGRRGIQFSIVTRESWESNTAQDVVYEVDNVEVSSPSGAPAQFTERRSGWGSNEELTLRIGDPGAPLTTTEATYVISYRVRGAMRTFGGIPELQWDILSDDSTWMGMGVAGLRMTRPSLRSPVHSLQES